MLTMGVAERRASSFLSHCFPEAELIGRPFDISMRYSCGRSRVVARAMFVSSYAYKKSPVRG